MTVTFENKTKQNKMSCLRYQFQEQSDAVDKRPPKAALLVSSPHAGLGLNFVRTNCVETVCTVKS